MAQIYFDLIKQGKRTIEQVPEVIRANVQQLLDQQAQAGNE